MIIRQVFLSHTDIFKLKSDFLLHKYELLLEQRTQETMQLVCANPRFDVAPQSMSKPLISSLVAANAALISSCFLKPTWRTVVMMNPKGCLTRIKGSFQVIAYC